MVRDADLLILERLLARELISAREAAQLMASMRDCGPVVDLQHSLFDLRPWTDKERSSLSEIFRSVADAPATVVDAPSSSAGVRPPSHVVGAPTPEPGRRPFAFERYEVVQEVARGGMGVVYKARDLRLGRTVALKVLVGGTSASAEMIERFHREARMVAGLQHPRIVPVHDVGETDGACYFTMDFIEGSSLARLIHDRAVSRRDGVALLREIALALHHAHEHGVIHRDVKPGNILVDRAGRPFIADFGLAREAHSDARLTATGRPVGTPVYMSPEQAGGDVSAQDPRTDVYSLGATLYELLTGRPPYEGDNMMEILFKVMGTDPPRPTALDPTVPRDLEVITLRAMERERARRYPSARALAEDLGRFLEGEAIAARPSGVVYRSWKRARRHPVAFTLAVTGALLAVMASGTAAWRAARSARDARELGERARAELAAGRTAEALALVGRLRSLDPAHPALPVLEDACQAGLRARDERAREEALLAEAAERKARRDRAQPMAESAQKLLELTDVLARHGQYGQRRERLQEAVGLLDRALAEDPDFAEAYGARGRGHRLLADPARALADLDRAVELRDTWSAPYLERIGVRADLYHKKSSPGMIVDQGDGPIQWNFRDLSRDEEAHALLAAVQVDVARVIALGVRPDEAHFVQGLMKVVDGHPDEAIAELTRSLEIYPYRAEAFQKRAFAHLMRNETDAADADITRALELWPAFAEGLCYRGVIRFARGRRDEAVADFEAAAAIDPEQRQAIEGKAMVLAASGDWAGAIPGYTVAVEKFGDGAAYVNRGTALLKAGRKDEALRDLDRAVALDPGDSRAWFMRGQARMVTDDLEGARADIERAVDLDRKDPVLCEGLAWVHERRGDFAAAVAAYDQALARAAGDPKYLTLRAEAKREHGDAAGAAADYAAALARDPDHPTALFGRARLAAAADRFPAALADLDRLLARRPDDPDARQLRGRLRGMTGDHGGARADFDAAVRLQPHKPDHRFYRGMANLATQRWSEAVPDLEAALLARPEGIDAELAQARLLDARWFAAHPGDWHDLENAFRQLGDACARAEAAYRRKDWAAAAGEYRAGLAVVQALLAARDPELARAVDRNPGLERLRVHAWYNHACCLGRQAESAEGEAREAFAREALDALRESIRLGFDDLDHVRQDPDLAPLRGRQEFEEALRSRR